ncbi:DUF4124 domain-containing protein [Actimicrobium sp. CCC2.4]|uniref:DUF4124 domain-containing protein n=1 Tax=Actimicrobium sp. CCC2.4 TaxID=3048606 RepID=UPI002AC95E06|nr:DUF4124 domain-containing protein [Actimicrobium sp. CCC2.4]MEB0136579.1 DUF4124 domain-containing protein [Actimicrobium sp. CCC2.4]WPX31735.1 DUF4124 domain-containing protein [Actimicrobium sp. CCC2.4]
MKLPVCGVILFSLCLHQAHAQNEVFLCVDERGNKEYKNTGTTKGCKKIDLPGMTIIATPKRAPVAASSTSAKGASGDFPKVDSEIQKARDNDRRQILLDELKSEEEKLAGIKKTYNGGEPERQGNESNYAKYLDRVAGMKEEIGRSEKNIEALKRELGNLK